MGQNNELLTALGLDEKSGAGAGVVVETFSNITAVKIDWLAALPEVSAISAQATGTDDIDAGVPMGNVAFREAKTGIFSHTGANSTEAESLIKSEIMKERIAKTAYTVTTKTPLSSADKGANVERANRLALRVQRESLLAGGCKVLVGKALWFFL